ncbi:MAG: peptide deformylase [Candidatus Niyogibacteria bacterium CG10_big_fil_rev_8_21_14_0_10_46_36]|uniref:Peptide deformylase n=1 Tax=Candidatus Niyogibacteria bacterium CG10_big_fil_rev_8_21_14_0_10_46_36 TaxID=1974726 RepID=A0A2H0TFW7_9BACT|nr:MAG: peptide deformylase [Candidatus Niyogibacteria bacterium CG10_big_fil_rev_8_21_14_0_10_46_36]
MPMKYKKKIVLDPDPVLRKKAEEVKKEDIRSPDTQSLIRTMAEVLLESENGVGLAAPQIGAPLRVFIVLKKVLTLSEEKKDQEEARKKDPLSEVDIYINPEIKNRSKTTIIMDEGCLSVPRMYGKIKRFEKVTLRAYNERGESMERGASGLLAEIFQHEVDHLNGILFIDSAKDVKEFAPPKEE